MAGLELITKNLNLLSVKDAILQKQKMTNEAFSKRTEVLVAKKIW